MASLKVESLSTGYNGNKILDNITIEVNAGEIVGLIGSNGAGKTTLIKSILGIVPRYEGDIVIDGVSVEINNLGLRGNIAYIPEIPLLYDELTLIEHMEFTAMANKLDMGRFKERKAYLLELFDLKDKLNEFPNSFSKGMKQKVLVMCAFLLDPSILIIDEPFIGLDPIAASNLVKIMKEKRNEGAAILMSTHVLDSAEKICDRFIVVNKGKVVFQGTLSEMKQKNNVENSSLLELFQLYVEENNESHF
ncbi:ABC transporter ATP-binding protein [Alkaliphilus peptidifermentans]|uniref:ABC-2 type transport system ATP-binding protein n=1 Tax=Alkaliphilus peptidifermentans DSM 18978 TaxID=1120976 RepID=A0A1G5ELE9_9FIRM|nr:ABC transporter ATP-binding protein [Alkaliphilus peptidifermentans]SCY27817.1 ABC-2 type transport system ATP-binding protein [Alkaliphilus peptidifermentans DSM 18978]